MKEQLVPTDESEVHDGGMERSWKAMVHVKYQRRKNNIKNRYI